MVPNLNNLNLLLCLHLDTSSLRSLSNSLRSLKLIILIFSLINKLHHISHIFTQWGWLILFSPDHFSRQHQIGEGLPNTLFLRTFLIRTDVITVRSSFSSSITTPWGKPSNFWTSWVYSHRRRVPSWIWIRWIQYITQRNHFKSPPALVMSTAMQNSAQTPSYFIPVQHFPETCFSPQTTRTTHPWVTTSFLSLTSKHDFCYTYGDHISFTHSTTP